MAITDYKITDGEITQRNVKSAPDVLSDTPNENKAVFDNLTEHFIGKYNDLIDNIDTDFVDSSEFAEGLTVTDKVRWRYALTKGTSIGLNFSGNITQITTGYRTIVGDIDGLTETDFMDCYLSINGTDYECGDSYASGNSILTSAEINGVTVEIIYDTANGNITLEHATNPLDTLYWNVSIYRSVAEKVPRKALPASVSNDGYTELNDRLEEVETHGKWNSVELDKENDLASTFGTRAILHNNEITTTEDTYVVSPSPAPTDGCWFKITIAYSIGGNLISATRQYTIGTSKTETISQSNVTIAYDGYRVFTIKKGSNSDPTSYLTEIEYQYRYTPSGRKMPALADDDTAQYTTASDLLNTRSLLATFSVSGECSGSANGYYTCDLTGECEGYRAVGITGYSFAGTNRSYQSVYRSYLGYCQVGEVKVHIEARNNASSSYSGTLTVYVLCIRDI